ncbi:Eukaryotic translation initiation factor 3 subunit I [Microtus ochrogaster]|uniref:Serine-threonine kinase receptor-associated protein n=1 Tax=Microtus ochrogaster TaxID=79684 RepID=A0A8J6H1H3_MICOH|nr:Eukaryotic translation initiation factor 3 subunit I [Microtus ochrogaster]
MNSITQIKYNHEGDLLFTVAKDPIVNVWYSVNGERLGTYIGHTGAVWCVDADPGTPRVWERVKGHFGPINSVAVHPDGKSYSSGGREGYVRVHVHYFDPQYFEFEA